MLIHGFLMVVVKSEGLGKKLWKQCSMMKDKFQAIDVVHILCLRGISKNMWLSDISGQRPGSGQGCQECPAPSFVGHSDTVLFRDWNNSLLLIKGFSHESLQFLLQKHLAVQLRNGFQLDALLINLDDACDFT